MILEKLQNCQDKRDLASLLKYDLRNLSRVLFNDFNNNYSLFFIDKKDGGKREILAPKKELKIIQKRLSKILEECYIEISEKNNKINFNSINGFITGKSIITNAKKHTNKKYVLNIDLKDFFPSITFNRIVGFFKKNKYFRLEHDVAILIAQIACYKGVLPQGSPSSPIISNLMMLSLDKEINILAKTNGLTYSRYADDITLSTNKKIFPNEIASGNGIEWNIHKKLETLINNYKFNINHKKIRMQYKTSRQEVTGIIVNKKVNVNRKYIRNVKAMLNKLITNHSMEDYEYFNLSLRGKIDFIYQVRKSYIENIENDENDEKKKKKKQDLIIKIFNNFLYFNHFINNNEITILTEGKTDKIYIDTAFSHFKNEYNYKINILKQSDMFTKITKLNGINNLVNFIQSYGKKNDIIYKLINKSNIHIPKNPVIIIIDSDEPAKSKALELLDNKDGFIFKEPNLYCFQLPELKDKKFFSIEYYFPERIRNYENNGKKFGENTENKYNNKETIYKIIDGSNNLSKSYFSNYIKTLKYKKISDKKNKTKEDIDSIKRINEANKKSFEEFKKIFNKIDEIINDYKKRCNSKTSEQ
ncbi:retron Ec67 family RNA-directed DNA polymerase/endonuclease [Brachyspira pilosicoli]|uniref:retron Ec67 family RNA-directed DNA polymerase/endonuclease n=1 Tax=Brachyspira pilosicoli TaxID=52584 RepID=UPI003005F42D